MNIPLHTSFLSSPHLNHTKHSLTTGLLRASILTGIAIDTIHTGSSTFTINSKPFINILSNIGYNEPYQCYIDMINNLIADNFIERIKVGYHTKEQNIPSVYKLTSKLSEMIKQFSQNDEYMMINVEKLKQGFKPITVFTYNNVDYSSIKEIVGSTHSLKEYNQKLKEITPLITKRTEYVSPLNDIINSKHPFRHYRYGINPDLNHVSILKNDTIVGLLSCVTKKSDKDILKNILNHNNGDKYSNDYYRSSHGRYYQSGLSPQFLSAETRNKLLDQYNDVDIKSATFSILYNFVKSLGIDETLYPTLKEYALDPDAFRNKIYQSLVDSDNRISLKYIKDVLNSLAFGAKMFEKQVLNDLLYHQEKSILVSTKGWSDPTTPLNICCIDSLKNLSKELRKLTSIFGKMFINKKRGVITNTEGLEIDVNKHTYYGRILSHIYQGEESKILKAIANFKYNGKRLINTDGAIGLLLHDGLYLHKDLVKEGIVNRISEYIKELYNYNLTFSVD